MKFIKSLIVFALVFASSMLILEFYLQSAEIQTPMETRIDPVIGPTYIPNVRVTRFNEGFHIGNTNAYGYLGEESPRKRVGDEFRILMLGDSYVMGNTVFERHHFIHILEEELGRSTGLRVDAMNFGKADFALANMYVYYQDFASEFEHDLALFFVGIRDLTPSGLRDRDLYPMCELCGDSLVIDYGFRESAKFRFYRKIEPISSHSAFFRLTYNARKVISDGETMKMILDKLHPLLFPNHKAKKYQPPKDMKLTGIVTAVLRDLARSGSNILVYKDDIPQELRQAVAATGIRTIDLSPTLRAMEAKGDDPYYWRVTGKSGHWNQEAHREIGYFLSKNLAASVNPDPTTNRDKAFKLNQGN